MGACHTVMTRDELIEKFTPDEVETTEDILSCVRGKLPVTTDLFRRLLLLFLRGHYASNANYMGFDHLNCYVWASDPAATKLAVEFTHNEDDRKPDNYPGIYVGFAGSQFEKIAQGNYAGNTEDLSGTHLAKESVCVFEIHHVAKRASDAYDLADLTARALLAMAGPLARNAGATGFEVMGVRPPKEKKPSPDDYYSVATVVQIKYTLSVTRSIESHRIRAIALILDSQQ